MNVIEAIIQLVDNMISTYVLGAFNNLAPTVEALWHVLFILFILFYGYRVIFSGQFSPNELIVSCLKIVVVLILATQSGPFILFFFDSFTQVPNELAGRLLTGTASAVNSVATAGDIVTAERALGEFYDRTMMVGANVVSGASWNDFGLYFYALMIWIAGILLAGYALFLVVLSKLAVAILLAVGPLFILLLMFQSSRGFFEGWFRALVNYAIIPVFVYSLLALVLRLIDGSLSSLEANSTTDNQLLSVMGPFVLIAVLGFVLLMQVTTMAAGVSGGFALSSLNFARSMTDRLRGVATGGRIGREARELGYLRSTSGLQKALTNARYGGSSGQIGSYGSGSTRSRPARDLPRCRPPRPERPPAPLPCLEEALVHPAKPVVNYGKYHVYRKTSLGVRKKTARAPVPRCPVFRGRSDMGARNLPKPSGL